MKGARPLAARVVRAPRPFDGAKGKAAAAALGVVGPLADVISGAAGSSPYLAQLLVREAAWLPGAVDDPERACADVLASLASAEPGRATAAMLRQAKGRAALLIALADLAGAWDLETTTRALSDLADQALETALQAAFAAEVSGPLAGVGAAAAGLFFLAMGKHGARELNYSSDIDLICLFDDERWSRDDLPEVRARMIQIVRRVVKLLSEITAEGYVFRTDLRLRPNPTTTPVCIGTTAAESYYESVGRTWERAAYIKARPAAGDLAAGARFLKSLTPFVYRRHLDFAAIEDAHDMRLRIRAHKGVGWRFDIAGHDVKLGFGGIREIEFFAQTQQLVRGGRDPGLRDPTTRGALRRLAEAGVIDAETQATLDADYAALRELEHRLQMIEDAQTHMVPVTAEGRERVAALGAWPDRAAFEAETTARCERVRGLCDGFFMPEAKGPETHGPQDLAALGFDRVEAAQGLIEGWLSGRVPATRGERARRRFKNLMPTLLEKIAAAASPDQALSEFDRFLSGLPAGVQLFALCEANPQLLDLIAEICAAAPRLAGYLGRHSRVLDAVLEPGFFAPLPQAAELRASLAARLASAGDYERRLDAARVWAKERRFRVGVQVLRGLAPAAEAGAGFSAIAEACLAELYPHVATEFSTRHGPPPGRGAAVIALGKLGSAEMTATSDLDLLVVCDPADVDESAGPKPLAASAYYGRLTQALIAALTAQTAEGPLYAVDMRLRPSGRQGPVAVRLAAFARYQREEAWTWEHLALTRARAVAGDAAVCADAEGEIAAIRALPRDAAKIRADVAEMRARVAEAHRAVRANPWALKHAEGGLMDIEFVAQAGLLITGIADLRAPGAALAALAARGWLSGEAAAALAGAHGLMCALQQVERVALAQPFDPATAGAGLRAAMARAGGVSAFEALETRLRAAQAAAATAVTAALGPPFPP